jgi:hypothetical protein
VAGLARRLPVQRWVPRIDRSPSTEGPSSYQITAATKLKEAQAALGAYRIKVLTGCLVDDLS